MLAAMYRFAPLRSSRVCRSALALGLALSLPSCAQAPVTPADRGPSAPVVEYLTRQEILTALPLRVRLPARYGADRVLVFVLTWGSRDWNVVELDRAGQTWSGEVSCRAVSTVTGDTSYFFLALDAQGEPVVGSGSPEWPHVATIVGSLPEGPGALPGDGAPLRCHDPADCPPDFPGCPAYAFVRPRCADDGDCDNGGSCAWDGYCDAPAERIGSFDEELDADERLNAAVRRATGRSTTASITAGWRGRR